ncbi:MAG: sulfatase-like hydrolase/transferase [Bacteroidales bacterium]|nr:sulfatase-like hydrolase/transferase [Bacteroidales bacterium]MBN2819741.1 sulfatase-like hydrolase/transferase [Bacteroidales bacterium]
MKPRLIIFLKYALNWLIFFVFAKLLFLFVNFGQSKEFFLLWPKIIFKGILLDFSAIGYVMLLPTLLLMIHSFLRGKWLTYVLKVYTWFFLVVFSILMIADLVIYPEWGFRLDVTPLYYMKNMDEALASVSVFSIILLLLLSFAIPIPFILLFNRDFRSLQNSEVKRNFYCIPVFLFLTGFLILPIRGGLGTAPINTGSVYFHENSFVNHACLNLPWNIIYSFTNVDDYSNPFLFCKEVQQIPQKPKATLITKSPVLKTTRPNILIIVLESFTAEVIGSMNETVSATPNFDSIINKGWLFTNFYASGDRSDKGLVAILSGYPSQPTTAIIKYPNKTEKLPGLAHTLKNAGYSTAFYYGGDIDFANMRAYMINCGFDKILGQTDFPAKQRTASWGVHDEFLFGMLKEEIEKADTPFFKVAFTLSSHRPYDVPEQQKYYEGTDNTSQYLNSIGYTDRQTGTFIHSLENNGLLKNTLVVFVADHGSSLPGNFPFSSPQKFRIPLVWYGSVLNDSLYGTQNRTFAGQTDIPAMLLGQLGINDSEYVFSRDMIRREFPSETYYAFHHGFGYMSEEYRYLYYREQDLANFEKGEENDSVAARGKLYYQNLYTHFLSLK